MAIKEILELVGSDVVIKQLGDVKKAGEETLGAFNKPLPELKFPEVKPPDPKPLADFGEGTVKLKDALHTLKPILQAAGLQIGEFGAFARLASGTLVGFGVALAGAVVVGLAKLEENAAKTKGELADLFGSSEKGERAFANLSKQAKEFGTTVDGLAPGLEAFQAALNAVDHTAKGFVSFKAEDLPGAQIAKNADAASEAYGNFLKLLRAGRLTQDDAQKSAKAFFDALKDGVVTSAALRSLPLGTLQQLKEAFGAAGLTSKAFFEAVDSGQLTVDRLEKALLNFGPQSQKAFDTKAIKTFSDEIGKLLAVLSKGFESLSGKAFSDFLISEIKRVTEFLKTTIQEFQAVIDFFGKINATISKLGGKDELSKFTFVGPTLEQAKIPAGLQGGIAEGFFPTPEQAGKAGSEAGDSFTQGFLKRGFVFPPVIGADKAGTEAAADFGKSFREAPKSTLPVEIDKTDAEKALDSLLKDLSEKTQNDLKAKPLLDANILPDPLVIGKKLREGTDAAKKIFDDFIEGIKTKWDELQQLKRPDFPIQPGANPPGGGAFLSPEKMSFGGFGATFTGAPKIDTVGAATFTGPVTFTSFGGGGGGDRIRPPPEFRKASFEESTSGGPAIDTSTIVGPFQDAVTRIGQMWQDLLNFISTSASTVDLSGVTTALVTPFTNAVPQIQTILQQIIQTVQQLNQEIQTAISSASQLQSAGGGFGQGGIGHAASGGLIRGAGTGTSDSILAWLSNREFVVNAKAVSHYGPEFFAALNAMRVPQNFNMGGMARMMAGNKFAGGGLVRGNPVVLNIDRKSFNMTAGDDTITQLKRFAVASQLSSTGRKPRWVK